MAGYFFGCPHCRAKLEARDASRAGRTVTCPQCEQALIIPPPPLMGVPLSQGPGTPPASSAEDASGQVMVSHDPGFKRPMSPAKAFGEGSDALPSPSSSGYDKLPSAEALQEPESHTLQASNDIEGYSFTAPENDTDVTRPPAFVFKPKKKRTPEEAPHPLEDPKNQLFALIAIVAILGGITALWSWLSSGDEKDKDTPAEAAPEVPSAPLPTASPPPGVALPGGASGLPGATSSPTEPARPGNPNALPGAAEPTPTSEPAPTPAPTPEPTGLSGAVPNVLPEANSESPPGTAPRPLPESTPNVLPGTTP